MVPLRLRLVPIRARLLLIRGEIRSSMSTKPVNRETAIEEIDDGFRLEDYMPYRLAVASASVSRLLARRLSDAYGISIAEWRVLTMVGRFEVMSPSVVGERTAMDKVKVSRAAASLVARGMIKQSQDPADGRGRLLRLTRKGVSVHKGCLPIVRELEEELAAGLSKAEWTSLSKALARIGAHVQSLDEPLTEEEEAA
jgi:DNA-binding MarR family transcriptional regulator